MKQSTHVGLHNLNLDSHLPALGQLKKALTELDDVLDEELFMSSYWTWREILVKNLRGDLSTSDQEYFTWFGCESTWSWLYGTTMIFLLEK